MKDVKNRHIVVAGAARSGIAAALLLKEKGAYPFVTDNGSVTDPAKKAFSENDIPFEEEQHSKKAFEGEFLVLSPGVPTGTPLVQHYIQNKKSVYSEIEFASWYCRSPIFAVTGSNGKTTVANWMAHTWHTAGRKFILSGNIGTAFSEKVTSTSAYTDALLEVSSFQLDHIDTFQPYVSMILNITPDHLDRYDQDFDLYAASKLSITSNQTAGDTFIYNGDDPLLAKHAEGLSGKTNSPELWEFSSSREVEKGAFIRDGHIILKLNNEEEPLMQIGEIHLQGRHNIQNGMATALAARASEIKNDLIRESLRTFEGVAHRLEPVRTYKGVRYINDSKATNVNAVWFALDSFHMPMVLILGGRDKGNDYSLLAEQVREKVHTVIAIGEAAGNIKEQLGDVVPHLKMAESMKEAVKKARKAAKRGEIVLLSPACSSFDMFENYEHRGNEFKQAVLDL
ncbi:MAG TPA: UDP-N-acetylmuramoyl-L-alanine--D-glutamate ligase [Bacteroidales bacterium]|nr:UDP-N-acetylmuramoyl-L-alanine--D-glutamate ligase [Bacteroidales bacterium]